MEQGWIKLHRTLLKWEWYHDSKMVHLLVHLILKANHEDKRWRGIVIKRGQLATSQYHLITICNYDAYQCRGNEHDQGNDKRPTSDRPATDHKQEVKEYKKKSVRKNTLFKDSGISVEDIAAAFAKAPDLKYADPTYYYRRLEDHGAANGKMYKDWKATARSWARSDDKSGKLVKLPNVETNVYV